MAEKLLNTDDTAKMLGVKTSWVRMAVFRKKIPYVKLGRLVRFKREDLEKFIKDNSKKEEEL
jgi:excisionase family DNA binding protein